MKHYLNRGYKGEVNGTQLYKLYTPGEIQVQKIKNALLVDD